MVDKGVKGSDGLREFNQKLKPFLPPGMFCCGGMIEADFKHNQLQVWNGGLPDGWLVRTSGELEVVPSRHLPLGLLPSDQLDDSIDTLATQPCDRLFMLSDGVLASRTPACQLFRV